MVHPDVGRKSGDGQMGKEDGKEMDVRDAQTVQ